MYSVILLLNTALRLKKQTRNGRDEKPTNQPNQTQKKEEEMQTNTGTVPYTCSEMYIQ